jgi:hypothetical protein
MVIADGCGAVLAGPPLLSAISRADYGRIRVSGDDLIRSTLCRRTCRTRQGKHAGSVATQLVHGIGYLAAVRGYRLAMRTSLHAVGKRTSHCEGYRCHFRPSAICLNPGSV